MRAFRADDNQDGEKVMRHYTDLPTDDVALLRIRVIKQLCIHAKQRCSLAEDMIKGGCYMSTDKGCTVVEQGLMNHKAPCYREPWHAPVPQSRRNDVNGRKADAVKNEDRDGEN